MGFLTVLTVVLLIGTLHSANANRRFLGSADASVGGKVGANIVPPDFLAPVRNIANGVVTALGGNKPPPPPAVVYTQPMPAGYVVAGRR